MGLSQTVYFFSYSGHLCRAKLRSALTLSISLTQWWINWDYTPIWKGETGSDTQGSLAIVGMRRSPLGDSFRLAVCPGRFSCYHSQAPNLRGTLQRLPIWVVLVVPPEAWVFGLGPQCFSTGLTTPSLQAS